MTYFFLKNDQPVAYFTPRSGKADAEGLLQQVMSSFRHEIDLKGGVYTARRTRSKYATTDFPSLGEWLSLL